MKLKYGVILLALVIGAICGSAQRATAQQGDTLTVEWYDNTAGDVIRDALVNAINNDTNRPAGRVYLLKKGGYYWNRETIQNTGYHLRIVGQRAGAIAEENPPVIQMVSRDDGSINQRMITGVSSITLKNLWITGADDIGRQTAYQPIQIDANDSRIVVDNCIIDRSNFALIAFTGKNNDLFFTNNKFRNLIGRPSTQQWEGRGISVWADQDTAIVENNTFFNLEFTVFQMEGGAISYLRFNHNTMINVGRNFLTGSWWREAYFTNNLMVNGFWHGEGPSDYNAAGRDPRQYQSGMMGIGALPSKYGPEQGRRILLANTAAWRDPAFTTYYGNTVRPQAFIGDVTRLEYFSGQYSSIVAKDTTWLSARPNFPTYPDTLLPKMWQNITDLRANVTPATPYFFDIPKYDDGSECFVCVSWPLPENFAYTTTQLLTAGTDKLPLGDLNWFPTQKAQWEANKAKNIADIEAMAGPKKEFKVVVNAEAEAGTLAGTAAISTFQGFSYFQMDGGGFMEWTFDLPAGGQYDLNIWTHMRNNPQRGQHTFINGVEIHDASHGWGELIYDVNQGITTGMKIDDWTWVKWTQADLNEAGALTFKQGQNVIKISSSWGYQNFAGIDLLTPGTTTVVKSLRAPDVTAYEIVAPHGEGAKFTPNGFKSVTLGTNGTITWNNVTAPAAGTYRLNVFYQNPGSSQTGQIKVDGATVLPNLALASKADSTGTNVLSDVFNMTAGSHTIALVGSQINVDYVQLIQEIVSSVSGRTEQPLGYTLAQNYPNPFNPNTSINFSIGKAALVKLTVYNVLGQKVATLIDKRMTAGAHIIEFDASKLTSGVYFYRLEAGDFLAQKRMLLIK
ncbi:MAG: hypothetical protein ALAOOOJD_02135 [bacterium]|nr:hypothetical protein [bacterium]